MTAEQYDIILEALHGLKIQLGKMAEEVSDKEYIEDRKKKTEELIEQFRKKLN